jgi:hypothetical protein
MTMFGFGKRKQPPSDNPLMRVIVPESAFEQSEYRDYEIVQTVVDYVNVMLDRGLYHRHELPQFALQAYYADYYLAQVNNGGHSQFIHNSGRKAKQIFADALAGLTAMGATAQAGLLQEMIAWFDANPAIANEQTGFSGGRAPFLDGLDDRFYDAEKIDPISRRAAEWISQWSDLRKVDDSSWAAEIETLVLANGKRGKRLSSARIARFHHSVTDTLHAAVALAAAAAEPPEALINIHGGYQTDIHGEEEMAWVVDTDGGMRFAVVNDGGARLYEYIEEGGTALTDYRPPAAGVLLGTVESSAVDALIVYATRRPIAAAGDLLLRRARPMVEDAVMSPQGSTCNIPNPVFWIIAAGESFALVESPKGFVLAGSASGETYGPLPVHEAANHAEALQEH